MVMSLHDVAQKILGPGGHDEFEREYHRDPDNKEGARAYLANMIERLTIREELTDEEIDLFHEALKASRDAELS